MLSRIPRVIQPREVAIRRGSLMRLAYLKAKRAVVLCGGNSLRESGNLEKIKGYLGKAGIEYTIVDGIAGDPTPESILGLVSQCEGDRPGANPEVIIACGGGAVLDSAKLVRALLDEPDSDARLALLSGKGAPAKPNSSIQLVAIPTTAGTGSESSSVSVLRDPESKSKRPLVHESYMPDIVILDAKLTEKLPPKITAETALDALSHAAESFCSRLSNPYTASLAATAGRLIIENLPSAIENPSDLTAREQLQYAAMLAGTAQNMTSVGATHALAHALAGETPFAHGLANAIFLVPVLRANSEGSDKPEAFVRAIGVGSLAAFGDWLASSLSASGIDAHWSQHLDGEVPDITSVAEKATKDMCMRTNPTKLDTHVLAGILSETR